MTQDKQLQVASVLTAVLRKAGKLSGRVRVQKTAYLLKEKGLPELSNVAFFFDDYGPYSAEVASVLLRAVREGLIQEHAESFDDEWQRIEYSLGDSGKQYAASLQPLLPESLAIVSSVITATSHLPWRALELAATVLFLKRTEKLTDEQALARAIGQAPARAGHQSSALRAISRLGLN